MRKYEALYILDPDLDDDARTQLIDRFKSVVEENGGTVGELDEWGKRKLAYPINGFREGYYVLMNFEGTPAVAKDLDRVFKITIGLLRHMIVNKEK